MGLHDYHFDPALLTGLALVQGRLLEMALAQRLVLALLVLVQV
jgi:hypothetical protein